ncbi:MAG: polyprenyl synthetase family protein [Planctomycetes bacterium]|nr:polyprenyl synthetase family protein [Planctomycetota bacterium]MCP4772454.1 polyprenyl synthetase family protein [Planctomycetota bacterium]MCP4860153.1 polyprenyl synthetase family protein [Planctomycetota bacterium]
MNPGTTATDTLQVLLSSVQSDLDQVEAWLEKRMLDGPAELAPLLQHVARFRGKRLRAAYVLMIAKACGGVRKAHIEVAGIVEMIHAATLIHDDMLDEAVQRRQLDCVHVEWGPHTAVLLGDWVYSQAFLASTSMADQECSRVLAEATSKVCAGEMFQNLTRRDFELSEANYFSQVDGKTAALFEAGGQLAAYYAKVTEDQQHAAAQHGLLSGRAFQVVDDLLDLEGDEAKVGKSLGTDWARGKMTLPVIRLRDALEPQQREQLQESFHSDSARDELTCGPFADSLKDAVKDCRVEIEEMLEQAAQQLNTLPERGVAKDLGNLTRFLGQRKR